MQQALCAEVRPGVDWRDVHLSGPRAYRGSPARGRPHPLQRGGGAWQSRSRSVFLPTASGTSSASRCTTSEALCGPGSADDIARPAGHPYLRLTRVLEPGFVVTMEPGIYFIDAAARAGACRRARGAPINWSRVGESSRFGGIRIEDDLAVPPEAARTSRARPSRLRAEGIARAFRATAPSASGTLGRFRARSLVLLTRRHSKDIGRVLAGPALARCRITQHPFSAPAFSGMRMCAMLGRDVSAARLEASRSEGISSGLGQLPQGHIQTAVAHRRQKQ